MERAWIAPVSGGKEADGSPQGGQLMLLNSLIDKKVPFVPASGKDSKNITWYTCGPTVYDSAHVGHARNYLAFDIVRRVLEDYFGYSILYVMNITDVEDKIILRARRKYLMAEYLAQEGSDPERLLKDAAEALAVAEQKQLAKLKNAEEEVERCDVTTPDGKKRIENLKEAAEQEGLLYRKMSDAVDRLKEMDVSTSRDEILDAAGDALAARLDEERKATVSDPEIFRAHAARFEQEFTDDMQSLNIRPPTVMTRVSEYIPEIVSYISTIVDNNLAYESNGSVYFDTQAFRASGHTYGKLNPWAVGQR
eukprot:jgi/Picre1/29321/NNA_004711.t1